MGVIRDILRNMHHGRTGRRSPMIPSSRMHDTRHSQPEYGHPPSCGPDSDVRTQLPSSWTECWWTASPPRTAAIPKLSAPSVLTCCTLNINGLAYRQWSTPTLRIPIADHVLARTGNRRYLHATMAGTLAVAPVTGFKDYNHKTPSMARTWQKPQTRRNASTRAPEHRIAVGNWGPVGIRHNRHSCSLG